MTTRRMMVWSIFFILIATSSMVTADSVQRGQGSLARMGDLHEGERFVFDLHFSSRLHDVETTLPDWLVVEIGPLSDLLLPDQTTVEGFTVTSSHGFTPWTGETSGGRESQSRQVKTEYHRLPDGAMVATETKRIVESWGRVDGETRTTTQDVTATSMGSLGSSTFDHAYPGTMVAKDNLFTHMAMPWFIPSSRTIAQIGALDGETVYDLDGSSRTDTRAFRDFGCSIVAPFIDYREKVPEGTGTLTATREESRWVRTGVALPVLSTCTSTYRGEDGVVEQIFLALEMNDHVPGDEKIPVKWNASTSRERPPATRIDAPHPVALPGVPGGDEPGFRFPLTDALDAVQTSADPRLSSFGSDAEFPFVVISANHRDNKLLVNERPAQPLDPVWQLVGEGENESAPATTQSVWTLHLQNLKGEGIRLDLRRNYTADGEQTGEYMMLWEERGWGAATPDAFPKEMVPLGVLLSDWLDREGLDFEQWVEDPRAELRIDNGVWHPHDEGDDRHKDRHVVRFQRTAPEAVFPDTEHASPVRSTTFDLTDGEWSRQQTVASMSRTGGPTAPEPAPRAVAPVEPVAHVPVAAAATGLVVALAFAIVFFWDSVTRSFAQILVAPLYAKIRKDQVLDHETRDAIVEHVRSHPAASLSQIRKAMGIGFGTTVHHLSVLEKNGLLTSRKVGRQRCYFLTSMFSPSEMDMLAASGTGAAARLLAEVDTRPGIVQGDLAARLGVKASSVRYQAKRLEAHAALKVVRDGQTVRYFPARAKAHVSTEDEEAAASA